MPVGDIHKHRAAAVPNDFEWDAMVAGLIAISCPGESFKGLPVIFVDLETSRYWRVETELDTLSFRGSAGMAMHRSTLWVATTRATGQGCLIGFDIVDGTVATIDGDFSDPHSILIKDERVMVVSTADNAIYSYPLDGQSEVTNPIYRLDDSSQDVLHINGICEHDDEIFVGMFGRRPTGARWSDAKNGGIVRLSDRRKIAELMHPHSIGRHEGKLLAIESLSNTVVDLSNNKKPIKMAESLGYLRGIASWPGFLMFGISDRRENRDGPAAFLLALVAHDGNRFHHILSVPGPRGYHEVYDLLYIDEMRPDVLRPLEAQISSGAPLLGPKFSWKRMVRLSFMPDAWLEKVIKHDVPLNINGLSIKLVVMCRVPLVHIKVVLSNDTSPASCHDAIEKWFDFYEGLSVRDIDLNDFGVLRGNFDRSFVRMSMIAGFMTGTAGDVMYQFILDTGQVVRSLTGRD